MTANECDGKNWRRGDRQIMLNILTFLAGQGVYSRPYSRFLFLRPPWNRTHGSVNPK